jgi:prophage antirepressor-like protein
MGGRDHQIRLCGTIEDPYFCGRDVCEVLGYKDPKNALFRYVDFEDKKNLKELRSSLSENPNYLGSNHNITHNEGQVPFISEAGLYNLIMRSNAPFAKEFQKLACKTILTSIRKYGSYQVENQLAEAVEKLAIKEAEEEVLQKQLEQEKEARVKAERKAIRVNKFMKRITIKEKKMEWIYIATNRYYALERLWKIGCTIRLSSRIGTYNTGRAKGLDDYYYVWAIKCYNSKDVDAHIQKLLADFKWNDPKTPIEHQNKENRSEMYHGIKFTDLKEIVAFIVNNYDASIDYINKFIKTRLEASLEEEDEVPPPLDYKRLTYQIGDHTETIDLEEEESDTVREALEDILTGLKEQYARQDESVVVVHRKDLIDRLSDTTNTAKKDLWSQIKELTGWTNSKTEIDNLDGLKYKIVY